MKIFNRPAAARIIPSFVCLPKEMDVRLIMHTNHPVQKVYTTAISSHARCTQILPYIQSVRLSEVTQKMFPDKQIRSAHDSLKFIVIFISIFGLLPVDGVSSANAKKLRFRWTSPKVIFSMTMIASTAFQIVLFIISAIHKSLPSKIGKYPRRHIKDRKFLHHCKTQI